VSKRVLIIGHNILQQDMGGARLRRLARLLPEYGWETVALCQESSEHSSADTPGLRLVEVKATDLTLLYSRLRGRGKVSPTRPGTPRQPAAKPTGFTSKLNRWILVPDKQMPWRRPAVRRGRELLAREKFDLIFASLEPRTSLLVAAELSRKTGVPCAFEYRDLWTANPAYHLAQPTALHRCIHARLERRALAQARRVSAVCRGIANYLAKAYAPAIRGEVALNYNFFDPREYPASKSQPAAGRPFSLAYAGAMYGQRSPHVFFEGLRAFLDQTRLTPEQFRFRWAGLISGINDLQQILDRTRVRPYIDFLGLVPHRKALGCLLASDAALVIQAPNDNVHIPGKLFEAFGARVPLLAVAQPCEVADIINKCQAGIIAAHDPASVAAALGQFHDRYRQRVAWQFNEAELEQYSAHACVRKLAAFLDEALT
jgi:glycosyltransferase involved in cell wall biosynthesis